MQYKPARRLLALGVRAAEALSLSASLINSRFRALSVPGAMAQQKKSMQVKDLGPSVKSQSRGKVALFTGCLSEVTDGALVESAIQVLEALGYDVEIPKAQQCCGALALHAGRAESAASLAERNMQAFSEEGAEAIITLSSACGLTLREYPTMDALQPKSESAVAEFSGRVRDISEFLVEDDHLDALRLLLHPLKKSVLIHTPCTLRNPLKLEEHATTLLQLYSRT